jgi:quinoprotein relay system zinc metallohydrolase 2
VDGAADVANLALVVGRQCAAVVDTGGSIAVGRAWRAAVARVTSQPVCYVITTHAHPDHALGAAAFLGAGPGGADPQFIGHARLPRSLAARATHDLRVVARDLGPDHADTRSLPPTRTVADSVSLDLGGRSITLRAWPTAHTDNDLSVWDEASGTLLAGDLVFQQHLPVLDGQLKGWLAWMAAAPALPVQRVLPGHGQPQATWPQALAPQQRYLGQLQLQVRQALRDGLTLGEALQRLAPEGAEAARFSQRFGPDEWALTPLFHRRNVSAAFAELEWEP